MAIVVLIIGPLFLLGFMNRRVLAVLWSARRVNLRLRVVVELSWVVIGIDLFTEVFVAVWALDLLVEVDVNKLVEFSLALVTEEALASHAVAEAF